MTMHILPDIERKRPKILYGLCFSFFLSAFALAQDGKPGGKSGGAENARPLGQQVESQRTGNQALDNRTQAPDNRTQASDNRTQPLDNRTQAPVNRTQAPHNEPIDSKASKVTSPDADHPFPRRLVALPFPADAEWLNTDRPLPLNALRGRFVMLDFWTYCCINCMHVLPELKKLEHAYPDDLVVIGVHSAKFDTEKESKNIADAVLRYEIEHPVINDSQHRVWNAYGVQSWPTVLLIDPEGYVVYGRAGEFESGEFEQLIKTALPYYRAKKVLADTPLEFKSLAEQSEPTALRFPGKVLADEVSGRIFIADSNHNRIVVSKFDGEVIFNIGSGVIGRDDGVGEDASFHHPQGMALVGETLYVADTGNHLLRKVDLEHQQVITVAGTGHKGSGWPGIESARASGSLPERWLGKPLETPLGSPWAVWHHDNDLYIAMAGPHQIWKMPLDEREIGPYAGNGREDIVDGPLLPKVPYELGSCSFAQPSGLTGDDAWLYVADSEGSSIRAVPFNVENETRTVVGTADLPQARLFTFGDQDGARHKAQLQHALGIVQHDGTLYVADTYNNKIKAVNAKTGDVTTIAGVANLFDEPAGISYAAGKLYVADTNNHQIRTIDLRQDYHVETLQLVGLEVPQNSAAKKDKKKKRPSFPGAKRVMVKTQTVRSEKGKIKLHVELKLPKDWKINAGAPMGYLLESVGEVGVVDRTKLGEYKTVKPPKAKFDILVPATESGTDRLRLSLNYYHCQGDPSAGICKTGSVIWEIPIKIDAAAKQSQVKIKYDVP